MQDNEYGNPGFETGKIWAIGWGVAAFLSLASGGMLGALAFALLAFDAIAEGERDDDALQPAVANNPFALPAGVNLVEQPRDQHQAAPYAPTVPVSVQVTPDIDIHNHIAPAGSARPVRTAAPAQSERRTLPPDLSLYDDPKQRMQVLLKAMSESGFPLGSLINHPFVWCWGRSQSGKTTIALMLAIARMAMGHYVSYFTTDDDYPRQLPWSRVEDSPEGYAIALDDVSETISSASKGELMGNGWVFDEMFAASAQHGIAIQPLLTTVLMKGAKTRGGAIGISQADTSSAHGLKGIDAAWRDERVSIQALHEEDELGDRHPTGRYLIARGDTTDEWSLPEWMLSQLNQWGSPDPVVWMQQQFPELNRKSVSSAPKNTENAGSFSKSFQGSEKAENHSENKGLSPADADFEKRRKTHFTRFSMPFEQAKELVEKQVEAMGKTEAIKLLWGVSPGSSKAYQDAVAEYKVLMGGDN